MSRRHGSSRPKLDGARFFVVARGQRSRADLSMDPERWLAAAFRQARLTEPLKSPVPVAIVMIALNEAHNMAAVLDNVCGWAQEVFLVDSYSTDATIDIALKYG